VLACADGADNKTVAAGLGVHQSAVGKWRSRFFARRLDGLGDEDRPGRPATVAGEQAGAVVVATLEETPKDATHWSRTSMAKKSGLSKSTIGRIWKAFRLKPHLAGGFKVSTGPLFAEKVHDVVGLYLNPPEHAVVLCADEKSQIQAYPGGDPSVFNRGQEADMTDSRSVADGISGVSRQPGRLPRMDGHERSGGPELAVFPIAEPGAHPGLVVAASVTDASATASPARTCSPGIRTPDNQALDRSSPVLPMMPGMPEKRTRDYVRYGTTTLFAALDTATGLVISGLHRQHRAAEWKKFLARIDREVPAGLEVHIVAGNYATHKTPAIQAWLASHPRFRMHLTPASSSWLNQVERWFGELTAKMLRRAARKSVQALEAGIRAWIGNWNNDPRPFIWTKTADEILESLGRLLLRTSGAGH
jgi:transposase